MSQRQVIEAALAAWREAERLAATATEGELEAPAIDAARYRSEFQRLASEHMAARLDASHAGAPLTGDSSARRLRPRG